MGAFIGLLIASRRSRRWRNQVGEVHWHAFPSACTSTWNGSERTFVLPILDDPKTKRYVEIVKPFLHNWLLLGLVLTASSVAFSLPCQAQTTPSGRAVLIQRKLEKIEVPTLQLKDSTLQESVEFLQQKSRALDPDQKGINFVINLPADHPARKTRVNLDMRNIPLGAALEYVLSPANLTYRVDSHAVVIFELPVIEKGSPGNKQESDSATSNQNPKME
jgi:hypothetical protein